MTLLSYLHLICLLISGLVISTNGSDGEFPLAEATVAEIQRAFAEGTLTSVQLVDFYEERIERLNPVLRGVLELSPDARCQAERADRERAEAESGSLPRVHGIPVLLKDAIVTSDATNTTMGSHALMGAAAEREATVAERLRAAGAVVLGKASMSEWYGVRSFSIPDGWCARAGQGLNPYVEWGSPCGSSSGSAISVAANMVTLSLGTETDASILCPADHNSVVGIKPTVGLTSRAGVFPVSPRQDTVGPICRTVSDAVYVLEAIVGYDPRDHEATKSAEIFIPKGGYEQFLKDDGLNGKRLGVVRNPFLGTYNGSSAISVFESHLNTMRQRGATVIDNLEIVNIDDIQDPYKSGEALSLVTEFKFYMNKFLKELKKSPVRSLSDIIAFNANHPDLEMMKKYGQDELIMSEMTSGIDEDTLRAAEMMKKLSEDGFEKLMKENQLDAMVTLGWGASTVLAIGGYPAISVPAGYEANGMPFGICFGGLRGTEPVLIEIAYGFEQATKARRIPPILKIGHMDLKMSKIVTMETSNQDYYGM